MTRDRGLSRRRFLLRTGWMAAGVTLVAGCGRLLPALPPSGAPSLAEGQSWIQLLPSGKVRFLSPRAEMGQGASVGLVQVVAAELNLGPDDIECVNPSTSDFAPVKPTVGSESIQDFFLPTAHNAALLREALRGRAARQAGVAVANVADGEAGFVLPGGAKIAYRDLASGKPVVLSGDEQPRTKLRLFSVEQHRIKAARNLSWNRSAVEQIVTGQMVYSRDIVVDGMLYGRVIKPTALGAKLGRVKLDKARRMPGVVKVFTDESRDCVGVICGDPFTLNEAALAVEIEWKIDKPFAQDALDSIMDVERYRREDDFEHTLAERGTMPAGAQGTNKIVKARYRTPMAAHAAMEPRAAVALVAPDRVDVWGAAQSPHFVRARISKITGHDEEKINVHTHRLGGAFGGRILCQAAEEAVLLSKEVGKPVRVQWTREEEFQYNHVHPPFDHVVEASTSAGGKIAHWRDSFTASPIIFTSSVLPDYVQFFVDFTQEDGSPRGALPPYDIANLRIRYSDIRTPLVTSAWRGLGVAPNTFAVESMMDELAFAAGIDPVEFRLRNLSAAHVRLKGVIEAVAKASNWGASPLPNHGRGMACAIYKKTPVAVVVEVRVDPSAKDIKVTRAWIAQDCGLVINPDQVKAQAEGNLIWGISFALKERLLLKDGKIEASNFDQYPVARMTDAPEIHVELIERGADPPIGAGEPVIAPTPAAVANAIHAATGKRMRRLPIAFEDIRSA